MCVERFELGFVHVIYTTIKSSQDRKNSTSDNDYLKKDVWGGTRIFHGTSRRRQPNRQDPSAFNNISYGTGSSDPCQGTRDNTRAFVQNNCPALGGGGVRVFACIGTGINKQYRQRSQPPAVTLVPAAATMDGDVSRRFDSV